MTATTAEINKLDGVTATTAELNIIDGSTSATSTTLADADRVVVNDAGTMKQVALTDFETYFESALDTLSNVTTIGTLGTLAVTGDVTVNTNVLKVDTSNNRVGIKTASPAVSLDIGTATDALRLPVGTTAQRPTPATGQIRYNSTLGRFEGYTDAWGEIGGGGGSNTFTVNTFTTANSTTTDFTLSQAPNSEDNLFVFVEGVFMNPSDYTLSGTTVTLDAAPPSGRDVIIYSVRAAVSGSNLNHDQFTCNGNSSGNLGTEFTLSIAPVSENNTQVFLDGVYQQKTDYSVSGTTLTMDTAPDSGAILEVMTFTQTNINVPVNDTVDTVHLKADAVTAAKIADGAISEEHLDPSIISGLTSATAVSADTFMIFDATDNALKKASIDDVVNASTSIQTAADATAIFIDSGENVGQGGAADSSYRLKVNGSAQITNNLQLEGNLSKSSGVLTATSSGITLAPLDNAITLIVDTVNAAGNTVKFQGQNSAGNALQDTLTISVGSVPSSSYVPKTTLTSHADTVIDVAGDLHLDASGQIKLDKNGAIYGNLFNSSNNFGIHVAQADKDLVISGNDGGSTITALSLDMSNAGAATFNSTISSGAITSSGTASGRFVAFDAINTTNAAGTEVAIGMGVVNSGNTACDVHLVADRVAGNAGSDFYIEQSDASGNAQETFRITETANATFTGNVSVSGTTLTVGAGSGSDATGDIVINDVAGAKYKIETGSYDLDFMKHDADASAYVSALKIIGADANDGTPDVRVQYQLGVGADPTEALEVNGSIVCSGFTDEEGIFFRSGFSSSNKYNVSILAKDHNGSTPDGLSINGYDGITFCTGANTRNEVVRINGGTANPGFVKIAPNSATGDATSRLDILGNSDNGDGDVTLKITDLDSTSGSVVPQIQFRSSSADIGRIRVNDVLGMLLSGSGSNEDDLVLKGGKLSNSKVGASSAVSGSDADVQLAGRHIWKRISPNSTYVTTTASAQFKIAFHRANDGSSHRTCYYKGVYVIVNAGGNIDWSGHGYATHRSECLINFYSTTSGRASFDLNRGRSYLQNNDSNITVDSVTFSYDSNYLYATFNMITNESGTGWNPFYNVEVIDTDDTVASCSAV